MIISVAIRWKHLFWNCLLGAQFHDFLSLGWIPWFLWFSNSVNETLIWVAHIRELQKLFKMIPISWELNVEHRLFWLVCRRLGRWTACAIQPIYAQKCCSDFKIDFRLDDGVRVKNDAKKNTICFAKMTILRLYIE